MSTFFWGVPTPKVSTNNAPSMALKRSALNDSSLFGFFLVFLSKKLDAGCFLVSLTIQKERCFLFDRPLHLSLPAVHRRVGVRAAHEDEVSEPVNMSHPVAQRNRAFCGTWPGAESGNFLGVTSPQSLSKREPSCFGG